MAAVTAASLILLGFTVLPSRYWGVGIGDGGLRLSEAAKLIAKLLPHGGNVWMIDTLAPQMPYLMGDAYKVGYAGHMTYTYAAPIQHYRTVFAASAGWEEELAHYGVSVVGITSLILPDTALVPLAYRLAWHPRWQLVGIDRQLLVFRKRDPAVTATPQERWNQVSMFNSHALGMAQASYVFSPDERTAALIRGLQKQRLDLDRPEGIDWSATDQAARAAEAKALPKK
jgi:hypothetical protein